MRNDDLDPARGVILAMLLGAALWVLIGAAVYWMFR